MSTRRYALAFASGLIFAIGLGISGMTRPSKVLGFLDFAGAWDPSLLCVMGAALVVAFFAYRSILARPRPLFDETFHVPRTAAIDPSLVGGAALFGIGWGIGGFCPGPAIVGAGATRAAAIFTVTMVIGMLAVDAFRKVSPASTRAATEDVGHSGSSAAPHRRAS